MAKIEKESEIQGFKSQPSLLIEEEEPKFSNKAKNISVAMKNSWSNYTPEQRQARIDKTTRARRKALRLKRKLLNS
jgi:hypothetical protein